VSHSRVERMEFNGRPAWRKRYGDTERRGRLSLLRWAANVIGSQALRPPAAHGGAIACATERDMIGKLAALGARVPEILHGGPTELVLSDLGPTLSQRCKSEPDPRRRADLLQAGAAALGDLHRRGGYVSQAVARNLTIDAAGVGFIDLEQDPSQVMDLPAAQARDWLLFVQSTARFVEPGDDDYVDQLHSRLREEDAAVRTEIGIVARRLRWLAPVADAAGPRAQATGRALRVLTRLGVIVLTALLWRIWADDAFRLADVLLDRGLPLV